MIVRSAALALGAAALASASVTATNAHASINAWRFVAQYQSLTVCQSAGKHFIARQKAHEYKCENDYTRGGDPALDLYVR